MKLFDIILKLIQTFTLTSSQEYQQLHTDVKEFELECKEDSKDPFKRMYAKLHKGVYFRLLSPFLFFWAMREVKSMMEPQDEKGFFD